MKKFWFSLLLCSLTFTISAMDIWVSPSGNKFAEGSESNPLSSVSQALRKAREARRLQLPEIKGGINIKLKPGYYHEDEVIWIRPEDSGTEDSPTTIEGDGKATIGGGMKINKWKKTGKIWEADIPEYQGNTLTFRSLWINNKKAVRARDVADFEKMNRILGVDSKNEVLKVPAKSVAKILNTGKAELVIHQMWAVANLRISSIQVKGDTAFIKFHQPESRIEFEHPWPSPMVAPGLNSPFYLTNHPALLDQPGEWYYNEQTRKLYYYPTASDKIENTTALVPAKETLVEISGTLDRPVEYINFKNLHFSHTSWNRPSQQGHVPLQAGMFMLDAYRLKPQIDRINNHKLDNQAWLGRPAAAVEIQASSHINFEECAFEQIGYSALDFQDACSYSKVENCNFEDIGGNGLLAGSFSPQALETHLPYQPADDRIMTHHLLIKNNQIHDVTNDDWGCVGIAAGYVYNVEISHNEISDLSYTGISLGWGWNRDLIGMKYNLVKANHIYHYAKHMYDCAGIYTLGAQPGTVVEENSVHSIYKPSYVHDPNHWFYLYTDEGSSFISVRNNYTEAEKFLQNANGPGNIWTNNGPMVNDSIKNNAGLIKTN